MELALSVKNQSIESSGITNDYREAICEYIWNGLEAHATEINVDYTLNVASGLETLSITDNGDGIVYENITDTFCTFLSSSKNLLSLNIKSKANKGKGRFSFSAFASSAKWITVYESENVFKTYDIILENSKKEIVNCTEPKISRVEKSGTKVEFENIFTLTSENMAFEVLESALLKEFAWFLYLYKGRNIKINVNGTSIDYNKFINTDFSEKILKTIDGTKFEVTLVVWKEAIREKFCCYFFNSKGVLKDRETTLFNRNTIDFNHSVFVKSDFFDIYDNIGAQLEGEQISLFVSEKDKGTYKKLRKFITEFIERKMRNYMSQKADDEIRKMMKERKTFPEFSNDVYGKMRQQDFIKVTKEIYKI